MAGGHWYDAAVVGGGFFGCAIATHLARAGARVVVLEAGPRLLGRASYNNQARVHNGYHYPRSTLTALRSRVNFPRFVAEYRECIVSDFEKYYAVARTFSKVTARQYELFFERVGAPLRPAPARVRALFDPARIEGVWSVVEYAFDADRLADCVARDMQQAGVEVRLTTEVVRLAGLPDRGILVDHGTAAVQANQVFNCTYARINHVLTTSGLPAIPLKHEFTEMALIEPPHELKGRGVTVMCGPFFSVMPFPPRNLYTLSHVRFTPQESWRDEEGPGPVRDPYSALDAAGWTSGYPFMVRDAARYMPSLSRSVYVDSLREVKTVLPASEADDSRPILLRRDWGLRGLHCVLGAKIDNIYDVLDELSPVTRAIARRAG